MDTELRFDSAGNVIPDGWEIMADPKHNLLPCNEKMQIGCPVTALGIEGYIRAVTFSMSKVRYSVILIPDINTIRDVDSIYVIPREGDRLDFGPDIYS